MFHLAPVAQDQAYRLVQLGEVATTNGEAFSRAQKGDPGRLWVVASSQTAGRGRNGRTWSSPPGNLYASLLLIDPAPPYKAPELGFVASVAAAHALRTILAADERVRIKWPNDILFSGAKFCGILLESMMLPNGHLACIAGIGVNCRAHPRGTPYPATDLKAITGLAVAPEEVFAQLSASIAHWLNVWDAGGGFAPIRAEWLLLAAGLGARLQVALPSRTVEGAFQTIDSGGRLVLNCAEGLLTIDAGDVFLTHPAQSAASAPVG